MVPVPMILGDPHLEPLAALDHPPFLGKCDAMQMRRHDGVSPEFDLTGETLKSQDISYVPDVFIVPEKDFIVAGDAEVI